MRRSHGPAPERVGARGAVRRPSERAGRARRRARAGTRFGIARRGVARRTGHRQDHLAGGVRAMGAVVERRDRHLGAATRPGYRSSPSAACWPSVEHAPVELLAEHVAWCGGELVRICPQLATRVETAPHPTVSDDATERFLVFEGRDRLPAPHRDAAAARVDVRRPPVGRADRVVMCVTSRTRWPTHRSLLLSAAANRASTRRKQFREPRARRSRTGRAP